jgi:hypothetical protein
VEFPPCQQEFILCVFVIVDFAYPIATHGLVSFDPNLY